MMERSLPSKLNNFRWTSACQFVDKRRRFGREKSSISCCCIAASTANSSAEYHFEPIPKDSMGGDNELALVRRDLTLFAGND